jgi:hypothetical protein
MLSYSGKEEETQLKNQRWGKTMTALASTYSAHPAAYTLSTLEDRDFRMSH